MLGPTSPLYRQIGGHYKGSDHEGLPLFAICYNFMSFALNFNGYMLYTSNLFIIVGYWTGGVVIL